MRKYERRGEFLTLANGYEVARAFAPDPVRFPELWLVEWRTVAGGWTFSGADRSHAGEATAFAYLDLCARSLNERAA